MLKYIINLTQKQLDRARHPHQDGVAADAAAGHGVSSQIQQVFINLILNAFDAMPNGGNLRITGRAQRPGGVEILFQDSGRGVARSSSPASLNRSSAPKKAAPDLGLTVSYNIITAHGGTLELVPDHGKGACFRVFLPTESKS